MSARGLSRSVAASAPTGVVGSGGVKPSDFGCGVWTLDPFLCTSTLTWTVGRIYLIKVRPDVSFTATGVKLRVNTADSDAGRDYRFGVYDTSGTRLATTAAVTSFDSTGVKTPAFESSVALTGGTAYYIAALKVAGGATTAGAINAFGSVTTGMLNLDLAASSLRYALAPSAGEPYASLPASFATADMTTNANGPHFIGLRT